MWNKPKLGLEGPGLKMDFYYIRQKLGARDCKFYEHKTRALSRLDGNFNRLGLIRAQYPKAQAQLGLEKIWPRNVT